VKNLLTKLRLHLPNRSNSDSRHALVESQAENAQESVATPQVAQKASLLSPFKGISSLSVILGVFFTIFVLTKYLSPIIGKLALEPIVIPVAALALLSTGQFEAVRLQQMLAENAGIIASTLGVVMAVLFAQNCVKSTLLVQSIRSSHRNYMMHAVAGILAPLATSALWALAVNLGYYPLSMRSIGVAILAIFAGPTIASLPMDSIASLGEIAKQARWPFLFILLCHLALVGITYKWVYRGLEVILENIRSLSFFSRIASLKGFSKLQSIEKHYRSVPVVVDVVVLGIVGYATYYFDILPWYISSSIAVGLSLILSEYKKAWCSDDTAGGVFEVGPDNTEILNFNEEEAHYRRVTRWIMVHFSVIFATLSFFSFGLNHNMLGMGCVITLIVGNFALLFRNTKIYNSAIKDNRYREIKRKKQNNT
jgi:uncharacterized membrane protein